MSRIEDLSADGNGFLFPKNSLGLWTRDAGRTLDVDLGLDVLLGAPVGLKEFAAGFGLNLAETAEVGVRALLEACELEIGAGLAEGFVVPFEPLSIGRGCGTLTEIPC